MCRGIRYFALSWSSPFSPLLTITLSISFPVSDEFGSTLVFSIAVVSAGSLSGVVVAEAFTSLVTLTSASLVSLTSSLFLGFPSSLFSFLSALPSPALLESALGSSATVPVPSPPSASTSISSGSVSSDFSLVFASTFSEI
ncbi:hypothetical protein WICPIJ_000154 [Wickerhamomyces pijperi]|uniref:Uncharacterized protein n=1 Tax=Wickerhamomyces pijperi TaxID=599730 RepID=A0A9P8TR36_WICPI|nr:hypothetical protein WICPIJ_000154 [Wickerhamomyces pijperi]